jgi:2-haloacid dehalogenase
MLDFSRFRLLTFDCYGTLIDWETGIFGALRPILKTHGKSLSDASLLELYSELEAQAEQGDFRPYREVLQTVVRGFGERLGFQATEAEIHSLPESLPAWPAFSDTAASLRRLKTRFQLAIMSNVDDDLFARTAPKLGVSFDFVVTAQQARAYKPSLRVFELAQARTGISPDRWLHVGQSIFHDMLPAKSLGVATVWVNRASPRSEAGAAKAAVGRPDLEVPDLKTLAEFALDLNRATGT